MENLLRLSKKELAQLLDATNALHEILNGRQLSVEEKKKRLNLDRPSETLTAYQKGLLSDETAVLLVDRYRTIGVIASLTKAINELEVD